MKKPSIASSHNNKKNLPYILKVLKFCLLTIGAIAMFLPFLWMTLSSFKPASELFQLPPTWIPQNFTLANFYQALAAFPFLRFLFNSVLVSTINTVVGVFTSALTGYILAKYKFLGRDLIFMAILGCLIVPFQLIMIPLYNIMLDLGWANSYYALTVPYFFNIFGIFLMRQFMLDVPNELLDAATIDGCSHFGRFLKIALPIVKPAIAALGIFLLMFNWNSYLWPLIVIDSMEYMTLPLGLGRFIHHRGARYDLLMAASLITTLPVVIAFLAFQKQFIKGIALTGIKG